MILCILPILFFEMSITSISLENGQFKLLVHIDLKEKLQIFLGLGFSSWRYLTVRVFALA